MWSSKIVMVLREALKELMGGGLTAVQVPVGLVYGVPTMQESAGSIDYHSRHD